jgi:purine-cytosine permease-like protein
MDQQSNHFGESFIIVLAGLVGGIMGIAFDRLLNSFTFNSFLLVMGLFIVMWGFVWFALWRYRR